MFWPVKPVGQVPETPPLIVVEVLSPTDKMSALRGKLADHHAWGVPHVWAVDPILRVLYVFDGVLREVGSYEVPELGLTLPAAQIFE